MTPTSDKSMAVIGAGPKGLAIAVKAYVLKEFGIPTPQVTLIEKNAVAAHWSGHYGYTNGDMILGTSPEKDVVFPIESATGDGEIDGLIRRRLLDFSWMAYLLDNGLYSDWIDRGRPAPCHLKWSHYLNWVFDQCKDGITFVKAEVTSIDLDAHDWKLELKQDGEKSKRRFDELMITGPGQLHSSFIKDQTLLQNNTGVFNLEAFWSSLKEKTFKDRGRVAIVGAGENAASILLALSSYAPSLKIDVISPKGFVATRSENYYENQFYSEPEKSHWKDLSVEDRIDFIKRTDLGVFSVHAMSLLNDQKRHTIVAGRVTSVSLKNSLILLSLDYHGKLFEQSYDQVIIASGFDQALTLKSLLTENTQRKLEQVIEGPITQNSVAERIGKDLAVEGLQAKLFLPMLAGLNQGPGFANLSCLGRLSDRILLSGGLPHAQRRVS